MRFKSGIAAAAGIAMLAAGMAAAQGMNRELFKPSTLPRLVEEMKASFDIPPGARQVTYFENAADVRWEVAATYTGQFRPLTPSEKTFVQQWAFQRQAPDFDKAFDQAYLFRADGQDYWIPVQPGVSKYFAAELKPGDPAVLDVIEAGGVYRPNEMYWCFLLIGYSTGP